MEVRNLEGAQAFRDYLAQIQQLLLLGDNAAMLAIERQLSPLRKAAEQWATTADPTVSHLLPALFTRLPWIGALLDALGLGEHHVSFRSRNVRTSSS